MIKREKYLCEIRGFYNSDLVKVITGVRRSGKSVIMEQIIEEIKAETDNIIYLDFDDRIATSFIEKWQDLVDYVTKHRKNSLCYVFFDEIQEIEDWALACRSLRRENCSVFITGSNSKLLSKEFTKELSGRYVSFRIRPFVFRELEEYATQLGKEITVADYLVWGGFPKRLEFSSLKDLRRYILELNETIVVNDIINRYKIRKISEFRKFVNFMLLSNSRVYSANSISHHMKGGGIFCSANTIQKWVEYLKDAYIIDEIFKYSKKTKKELEQSRKIYNCDVSLNSLRCTEQPYDLTHNLENIVYNELLFQGFSLRVFDNNGKEIDFIAHRDNKNYYIQVAYSLADAKAYKREFTAFDNIPYYESKIIISNDDVDYSTSNIRHISLKKFLVSDI